LLPQLADLRSKQEGAGFPGAGFPRAFFCAAQIAHFVTGGRLQAHLERPECHSEILKSLEISKGKT